MQTSRSMEGIEESSRDAVEGIYGVSDARPWIRRRQYRSPQRAEGKRVIQDAY